MSGREADHGWHERQQQQHQQQHGGGRRLYRRHDEQRTESGKHPPDAGMPCRLSEIVDGKEEAGSLF
jgi:hypothetical protein